MSLTSISTTFPPNSLLAAYRPVVLTVNANDLPPVVYCDIYFNSVFYKTLSKTVATQVNLPNSHWQFDIQDAAQEYLQPYLGANGGTVIAEAAPIMLQAFCRFRSSSIDANGFIQPEGTAPVQATGNTPAVPGTGSTSFSFYIVNCTLQHEDNQVLATHLSSLKTWNWDSNCFPLTHRPAKYHIGKNQSDYFPAVLDDSICIANLNLYYRFKGQTTFRQIGRSIAYTCNGVITSITVAQVAGTPNAVISWTATGSITGFRYRVDAGAWIATTSTTVVVFSLTTGTHSVDVEPQCQCTGGTISNKPFTIIDPVIFVCTATVTDLAANQTNAGEADFTFTSGGDHWGYVLDGGVEVPAISSPFTLTGLSIGTHSIRVLSYCSNGVAGGDQTISFDILGIPYIIKTGESVTVGIRNQTFEIGPYVNAGNVFTLSIYTIDVIIVADPGDIASNIATRLRNAINSNNDSDWNAHGLAPIFGTPGYPPFAGGSGNVVQISMDAANSFTYSATLF